jgi:hypothetical protein
VGFVVLINGVDDVNYVVEELETAMKKIEAEYVYTCHYQFAQDGFGG